jgi:DNA-binding NarL/FixJ family response regulator
MIRVLVVADSGSAMAAITASLSGILEVDIVGYANGGTHVAPIVRAASPDIVLVDEMHWPPLALARIDEACSAGAGVHVVGLAESPDAGWVLDALRAGAATVVPRGLDAATLATVLRDVLRDGAPRRATPPTERSAA